jgi:hypothetical protein
MYSPGTQFVLKAEVSGVYKSANEHMSLCINVAHGRESGSCRQL